MSATISFIKCADLVANSKKIYVLLRWIISPQLGIGNQVFRISKKPWWFWLSLLGFGVPRWPENAFPSLVPWTCHCAKAPHFLYCVPRNIHSPASFKNPVQLPVQISVTSNGTVLNSKFYPRGATQGGHGSSYKNLERKTVS